MMRNKALLPLLPILFACGNLGNDAEKLPLVVLNGQLAQTSVSAPTPSNVRVAIVWATDGDFKMTYDVPVTPVFPSSFKIDITDPPPAAAMMVAGASVAADPTGPNQSGGALPGQSTPKTLDTPPPALEIAVGTLIAYEDLNGNGRLDLIRPDMPTVDRVLGANERLTIQYIEGDPAGAVTSDVEGTPVRGYNLFRVGDCKIGDATCARPAWLPMSTLYDLPLTADPELAEEMCDSTSTSVDAHANTTNVPAGATPPPAPGPSGWPQKGAPGLLCAKDNKTYSVTKCETASKGLCKGADERCSTDTFGLPSATPPPEWPCPN